MITLLESFALMDSAIAKVWQDHVDQQNLSLLPPFLKQSTREPYVKPTDFYPLPGFDWLNALGMVVVLSWAGMLLWGVWKLIMLIL